MPKDHIQIQDNQIEIRRDLKKKAEGIRSLLRENAWEADKNRRLPEGSVQALTDAGLFRICSPAEYGGYGGHVRTYMDAISNVGQGCGSAAWVAFISNTGAWIASYFPKQTRDEVFGTSPDTKFIGLLAPTAKTEPVEGGLKVNGRWGYASGSYHADWALLAVPAEGGLGLILTPMSDLSLEETWDSIGVAGSGSNTVIATDLFVPQHRILPLGELMKFNALGDTSGAVQNAQAFAAVAVLAVAAPVLGMANAALELTRERMNAGGKRLAYSLYDDSRKSAGMQLEMAEAASLIGAANTIVNSWCDCIVSYAMAGEELAAIERSAMRAELGLAMSHCREGVGKLLSIQGASAFSAKNPIQRIWRDLETAIRHGLLTPEVPLEIYGRMLFDDEPNLSAFL